MLRKRRILVTVSILLLGGLLMGANAARKKCWYCYCTDGSAENMGEIPFQFIARAKCTGICFPKAANVSGVSQTSCPGSVSDLSPVPDPRFD